MVNDEELHPVEADVRKLLEAMVAHHTDRFTVTMCFVRAAGWAAGRTLRRTQLSAGEVTGLFVDQLLAGADEKG